MLSWKSELIPKFFFLLFQAGYPPFWSTNREELFGLIARGKYSFADEEWKSISEGAKRLIKSMVRKYWVQGIQRAFLCLFCISSLSLGSKNP